MQIIEKYSGPKSLTCMVTFLIFIGIASIFLTLAFTVGQENESNCGQEEDYYNYDNFESNDYLDYENNTEMVSFRLLLLL